jgi:hypothetical protein
MAMQDPSRATTLMTASSGARRINSVTTGASAAAMAFLLALSNAAGAQTASPNVAGNWLLTCTNRKGATREVTLALQQEGSRLNGSYSAERGSGALDGTLQGTEVSLTGGAFTFSGTIAGNTMTGQTGRGRPCSAVRQ